MKILALIQVSRDLIPPENMIFFKYRIFENSFGEWCLPTKTQPKNEKILSFCPCSEANGIHLYIYINIINRTNWICVCVCVCMYNICEQNFGLKCSLRTDYELSGLGFWCAGWGKPMEQCSNKKIFFRTILSYPAYRKIDSKWKCWSWDKLERAWNQRKSRFFSFWGAVVRLLAVFVLFFVCRMAQAIEQYNNEKYFSGWFWHTEKCDRVKILALKSHENWYQQIFFSNFWFLKILLENDVSYQNTI